MSLTLGRSWSGAELSERESDSSHTANPASEKEAAPVTSRNENAPNSSGDMPTRSTGAAQRSVQQRPDLPSQRAYTDLPSGSAQQAPLEARGRAPSAANAAVVDAVQLPLSSLDGARSVLAGKHGGMRPYDSTLGSSTEIAGTTVFEVGDDAAQGEVSLGGEIR